MANEFKVKNSLLVEGSTNSVPIIAIRNASTEITNDASQILVTGKAIYDFVTTQGGSGTLAGLTDVQLTDLSSYQFLQYDLDSGKWINVSPAEASLYFWPLDVALIRESSIGTGLTWIDGYLTSAGGGSIPGVANGLQMLDDGSIGLGGTLIQDVFIKAENENTITLGWGDIEGVYGDTAIFFQAHSESAGLYCIDHRGLSYVSINPSDGEIQFQNSFIINDNHPSSPAGFQYGEDYSASFTDRSLVDRGFVEFYNAIQDTSILALDNSVNELWLYEAIQDASILAIEASMNDVISLEGLFLKESSIGSGLYWVNGLLDVSIEGGSPIRYPNPSTGLGNTDSQGLYCNLEAGAAISNFSLGYIDTNGRVSLADADASNLMPAVCLNTSGGSTSAGTSYDFLIYGVVKNTGWSLTIGKPVYVSATGTVTSTPPSSATQCVQVIGRAISPNSILFNPSPDFVVLK